MDPQSFYKFHHLKIRKSSKNKKKISQFLTNKQNTRKLN